MRTLAVGSVAAVGLAPAAAAVDYQAENATISQGVVESNHAGFGTTTNRPMDITVNGVLAADEKAFPGTGAWTSWTETSVTVNLNAGTNTIRATATTSNG